MADNFTTLADVAVFDNLDADLQISDVLDEAPTIAVMTAQETDGRTFVYEKKTAGPAVGFRAANAGRELSKATHAEITAVLSILDASTAIDLAVASADKRGAAVRVAMEIQEHLQAAFFELEKQFYLGTDNDAGGFDGLDQLIDAGLTLPDDTLGTGAIGAPVYAIRRGPKDTNIVIGELGRITVGDTMVQDFTDATGKHYPAYYTPITSWFGAMVGSKYSAAKQGIVDGLNDDKLAELWSMFPAGRKPNLFATTRAGLGQLQASRTATNPTGAPAPFPTMWSGAGNIPIVTTDALVDTVGT